MSGYKAIRALKEANKSQSRLIEKLTARNKALGGGVGAAKKYNEFMCGDKGDLGPSKQKAQEVYLFGKLSLELSKLEEV